MKAAFLALAGAVTLSTAFAVAETAAFVAMVAVPAVVARDATAADALYRWKEPDGSLTYSPTAPTDGTPYDQVDPMTMRPPSEPATETGSAPEPLVHAATPIAAPPVPASATRDDDPPIRGTNGRPGDGTPALGAAAGAAAPDPTAATGEPSGRTTPRAVVSGDKERRCDELAKRVVSLERRLSTALSPEAMDDTVVQMARYQQSVERHCR